MDLTSVHRTALSDKGHHWSWCGGCGYMVLCGTCGMNTCSGGSGEVGGEPCPDCSEAYQIHKHPTEEQTAKLHTFLNQMVHDVQGRAYRLQDIQETADKLGHSAVIEEILTDIRERKENDPTRVTDDDLIGMFADDDRSEADKAADALNHRGYMFHQGLRMAQDYKDVTDVDVQNMADLLLDVTRWGDVAESARLTLLKIIQSSRLH